MEATIRWKKSAVSQFAKAVKYIENDSPINSEKFEKRYLKKLMVCFHDLNDIHQINIKQTMTEVTGLSKYWVTQYHIVTRRIR